MAIILITSGPNLEGTGASGDALRLISSGVTPGSYTNSNITVNAQGIVTAASNGSAGGTTQEYDAGSGGLTNFWVRGGPGITVTTSAAGVYLITVPDGILLERFWKELTNFATELDGSGNMEVTVSHATAGVNTSRSTAKVPVYKLVDSGGNQREPADVSVTVQLTSVGSGDTVQSINGINGLGQPAMIIGMV